MLITILALLFAITATVQAQDFAERPLQKLIDCPSAGGPEAGSYDFELRSFPNGGLLAGFSVGLFGRFGVGLFHGGTGIIGYSDPEWNPQPGVSAQFRIMDESFTLPAITVGFTSQGYGAWIDSSDRYQFKAKGFYAVTGKNFAIGSLAQFSGHFGVNINIMEEDSESLDAFIGIDLNLSNQVTFIAEYSAGFDDNRSGSLGKGKGYLNAGIRWTFAERLAVDLHLKDILINQGSKVRGGEGIGREIRISYVERL